MCTTSIESFHANRFSPRAGFLLAPLLYMLALGGIGAAVIFSGYSQVLRSNAEMSAISTVRQQLNAAAQTLSASAALDTATSSIVQPPAVAAFTGVSDTTRLPGNYANIGLTGTPHDSGIIDVTTGVRQLDPWGKYYVYCRWENAVASPSAPSIMVISAGPDGVLSTKCGDTVAQGDDRINKLTVAEAINRANVWQVNTASQVKFGIAATAVKVNDDGSMQAASLTLTTPLAITSGGTGAADVVTARTNLNVPSTTGAGANGIWGIDVTGNAATATALKTARQFSIAGASGLTAAAMPFDGTADVALSLAGTLAIANGGTGATTAAAARTNLGSTTLGDALFTAASASAARTSMGSSVVGDALFTAATAATARTMLGLGTIAIQNANAVAITGGTLDAVTITNSTINSSTINGNVTGNVSGSAGSVPATGITGIVALANGGTGVNATSNANLRNQLGIDNASNLLSGFVGTGLLGTGVANVTTFLRGDGAWATVPAGATALSTLTDVTLTSPVNGNVLQYNGTKWVNSPATTAITGGIAPSFSVNKSVNQTVPTNSSVKVTYNNVDFDTNNNWSAVNNRYTPTIAGKYIFDENVYCTDSTSWCEARIYKNGVEQVESGAAPASAYTLPHTSIILDMNGTTDYVEGYAYNGGGTTIGGAPVWTRLDGALLAPLASGSVAGTGTANYVPKWSNSTNLTNSLIFDNGTGVGIGTATPAAILHINGQTKIGGLAYPNDYASFTSDGVLSINTSAGSDAFQVTNGTNIGLRVNPNLGRLYFSGNTGNDLNAAVTLYPGVLDGPTAIAFKFDAQNSLVNTTAKLFSIQNATVEKFNVMASGNVGIGTTGPLSLLDVNGGARLGADATCTVAKAGMLAWNSSKLQVCSSAGAFTDIAGSTGVTGASQWTTTGSDIYYTTGNVGIGTATPTSRLHTQINADATTPQPVMTLGNAYAGQNVDYLFKLDATKKLHLLGGSAGSAFYFDNNAGTNQFFVNAAGNGYFAGSVGIGTTSPATMLDVSGGNSRTTNNANSYTQSIVANTNTGTNAGALFSAVNGAAATAYGLFGTMGTGYTLLPILQNRTIVDAGSSTAGIALNTEGANPIVFGINSAEKMRIDSAGNVGIGTTSPAGSLDVYSAGGHRLLTHANHTFLTGPASGNMHIVNNSYWDGTSWYPYDATKPQAAVWLGNGTIALNTGAASSTGWNMTTQLFVANNGNVGIGTTSPTQKLSVAGTIESTSGGIKFPDGTTQTTAAASGGVAAASYVTASSGNQINSASISASCPAGQVFIEVFGGQNLSGPPIRNNQCGALYACPPLYSCIGQSSCSYTNTVNSGYSGNLTNANIYAICR